MTDEMVTTRAAIRAVLEQHVEVTNGHDLCPCCSCGWFGSTGSLGRHAAWTQHVISRIPLNSPEAFAVGLRPITLTEEEGLQLDTLIAEHSAPQLTPRRRVPLVSPSIAPSSMKQEVGK